MSEIGEKMKDDNKGFSAGNATNVVGVWAAREVLKSTLEFTHGGSSKEIRHNISQNIYRVVFFNWHSP